VDEPLDELDIALLQLGNEPENIAEPHVPQSPQSPEPPEPSMHLENQTRELPKRPSLKRASPDINDQEDCMDYNQENPVSPHKRAKHLVERSMSPQDSGGMQNYEDDEWNEERRASDHETEDQDSTYNPSGLKKKNKKKKSKVKGAKKSKAGLAEYNELDLTSSPKRTPFAADDERLLSQLFDLSDFF